MDSAVFTLRGVVRLLLPLVTWCSYSGPAHAEATLYQGELRIQAFAGPDCGADLDTQRRVELVLETGPSGAQNHLTGLLADEDGTVQAFAGENVALLEVTDPSRRRPDAPGINELRLAVVDDGLHGQMTYQLSGRECRVDAASLAVTRAPDGDAARQRLADLKDLRNASTAIGQSLGASYAGQYALAASGFQSAQEIRNRVLGPTHPETLTAAVQLAATYLDLGRAADAAALAEPTYRDAAAALGERHRVTLYALHTLAVVYKAQQRIADAFPLFEKAYQLRSEVLGEKHPSTLASLNGLAGMYWDTGKTAEALPLWEKVYRLRLEALGERHPDTLRSLNNVAACYHDLGRIDDALAIYERIYHLQVEVLGEKHPDTLLGLDNLGQAYRDLGRFAEGIPLMERAYHARLEVLGEKHPNTIWSVNNLAVAYRQTGQPEQALPMAEQAYQQRVEVLGQRNLETLLSLGNLAAVYRDLGRKEEAVKLYEKAYELLSETRTPTHPDTLSSVAELADAYRDSGRIADAITHWEELVRGVESLRVSGNLSPENRQALLGRWLQSYVDLSVAYAKRGDQHDAFRLSELSKARTLLESLTLRRANASGILTRDEQQHVEQFEHRIALLNDSIAHAFDHPETRITLEADKNALLREFAAYRGDLVAKHPKYARLSDVRITDERSGKMLLAADTVFISYLRSNRALLAFTLSQKQGLRTVDLGDPAGLDLTLETYRTLLSTPKGSFAPPVWRLGNGSFALGLTKPENSAERVQDVGQVGDYLTAKLLRPLEISIARKRRWVISPDGALALIPFEALPWRGRPVIVSHDVNYVQSLSVLALIKQRQVAYRSLGERKELFAMGAALYQTVDQNRNGSISAQSSVPIDLAAYVTRSANDPEAVPRAYGVLGLKWQNLPASEREIDDVASLFAASKSAVYKKSDATEAKLVTLNRERVLERYRYLLFSTHGYLSTQAPMLSAIVLGQVDKLEGTDGYITAAKWLGYDVKSDLIVLSACDTGVGKEVAGEGIMGLPFALYVAGNTNTVLSLWPVIDTSTAQFMTTFFAKLKRGEPPVRALANTKRAFLRGRSPDDALTVYWAPFVLYGL